MLDYAKIAQELLNDLTLGDITGDFDELLDLYCEHYRLDEEDAMAVTAAANELPKSAWVKRTLPTQD